MRSSAVAIFGLAALAAASPVRRGIEPDPFPFKSDGFPDPTPQQLLDIEQLAHGTLSNATPPANASSDTIFSLSLIAVNELFEVAFFDQLLQNVTDNVWGYRIENWEARKLILDTITLVKAQEELHAKNALNALAHFGAETITPCSYNFPVSDFDSAINLVVTFTSLVLGTLQDVIFHMGESGDAALSRGVASVVGQEGEQNGYWRLLDKRLPSDLPFMTTSVRDFAFNALNQTFLVPGTCGNLYKNPAFASVHSMQPLTLLTDLNSWGWDEKVKLSFELPEGKSVSDYVIAYINQQNVPFTETLSAYHTDGQTVFVEAKFPQKEQFLNGLTIGAIVPVGSTLANAQNVSDATLAGPALFLVN